MIVLFIFLAVSSAYGHVCLLEPHQRGPMSVATPADPSCFRRVSDCGGFPAGPPAASYKVNEPVKVLFQQNLNHWSQARHGHMDLAVSYDKQSTWEVLQTIDDYPYNDMVAQTNFSLRVTFSQVSASAVLRVRYVSYNPYEVYPANNTDAIFYNCADIEVTSSSIPPPHPAAPVVVKPEASPTVSCATPPVWVAEGLTKDKNVETHHQIWWDQTAGFVRWDRQSALLGNVSLVTNYSLTSEGTLEYGIDYATMTCLAYGSDQFYPWAYGPASGMTWVSNNSKFNEIKWKNAGNGAVIGDLRLQ